MLFTQRFNEALKQSSYTQTEIAKIIGISKQCISDYKQGKSFPSIFTLYELAKILEISADYLLGLSNY